jgi:YtcA family
VCVIRKLIVLIAISALLLLLAGCQRAPSVDILGSFFPIWIFCIALGAILAVAARQLFIQINLDAELGPGILIYPSLAALFAFLIWLIFFR